MKLEPVRRRDIPENLEWKFERAKAALYAGVDWNGSPDTVGGLTKDEAIGVAIEFLDAFKEWLENPE